MSIIAFDLSLSNSGIAVFDDTGKCIHLQSVDTKKEETHPLKLRKIESAFKQLKKKFKPSLVVIEESFTRFNKSTHAIYKVKGLCELIFWDIEQITYHATTVRKEVLGHGNAKKDELQKYILEKYNNISFDDYDQSDAFALGLCYFKKKGVL